MQDSHIDEEGPCKGRPEYPQFGIRLEGFGSDGQCTHERHNSKKQKHEEDLQHDCGHLFAHWFLLDDFYY